MTVEVMSEQLEQPKINLIMPGQLSHHKATGHAREELCMTGQ